MRPQQQEIRLPQAFIDAHVNHFQLMRRLGLDEPGFFAKYLAGEIPPGVAMTEFFECYMIVWPKADIDRWFAAGRPANAELFDRRARVLVALRAAIEAEHGCDIRDLAAGLVASSN